MSRQNFGAFIVSAAVVLGLIVVVFIVPAIQPRAVEARNALDEAADRGARRLNLIARAADRAVQADRRQLGLPAEAVQPDEDGIRQAVARNADLLGPTRKLAGTFRELLAARDAQYNKVAREAPEVDMATAQKLEPPAGETAQIGWLKESYTAQGQPARKLLAEIDTAINDLNKSISEAGSAGLSSSDHHRVNYVLAGLQTEKAMLLANLAANRRAQADVLRNRLLAEYRWYTDAATQARAIGSRLKEITFTTAQAATAAPSAAPATMPADAEPAAPSLKGLPAAEEPAEVVAKFEQEVDRQIAQAEQRIAQLRQAMAEPQKQLEQARVEIQQLQQQLAQVEQAGYDVTSSESFEQYRKAYSDLSAKLRQAEATAQALQEGTMAGATPDPESLDDLTRVKYVGGQAQVGLTTLRRRLEGEQKTLATLQDDKKNLQNLRASLVKYNQGLAGSMEQATSLAKMVAEQVNKTVEQLNALMAEAASNEDQALAACKAAELAYNTALQAAKAQQSKAASDKSQANPSPDKPNLRLDQLAAYDSPQAGAERGLVTVYMLMAQIQLERAEDLKVHHGVLQLAQACGAQVDLAANSKAIQEALSAAVVALASPDSNNNALFHAEQLSRLIQRERFTWLGPVTRGLVYNLLAQVQASAGQPMAAESRAKAVEALGEALKGNENSELLQPYSLLMASLQQR